MTDVLETYPEFKQFIAIRSISSDSSHKADCLAAAQWLVDYLKHNSVSSARLYETAGLPVVYAEIKSDKIPARTLLFYGHYDVQPTGDETLWKNNPFDVAERDGKLFGRGTADDKGQILTFLAGLFQAQRSGKLLNYNVKILIEGEEEIGGPNIGKFVEENKLLLKSDFAFVADTDMSAETPEFFLSLRGLVAFSLTLTNAPSDLHSGTFGGAVLNPANELSRLISKLVAPNGEVHVPGFYANVEKVPLEVKVEINQVKDDAATIADMTKAKAFINHDQRTLQERTSIFPTFEVNAIRAGSPIESAGTIIPSKASTRISCRLVPNQDPLQIFELIKSEVTKLLPVGMQVSFELIGADRAVRFSKSSPYLAKAIEVSERVWKNPAKFNYTGGSIGVIADLKAHLGVDSILLGFCYGDANIHGTDENFPVEQFFKGKEFVERLLTN